jgi:predicted kinase
MKTKKDTKTLHILMGLPASGKSYWSRHYTKSNDNIKNVSLDEAPKKYTTLSSIIENYLKNFNGTRSYEYNELILDGLFLDQASIEKVLDLMVDLEFIDNVLLHFWVEDRELCLFNDEGRRSTSSSITIKNSKLEQPSIDSLNEKYNQTIKMEMHEVIKKSEYEAFKEKYNLEDMIKSYSWSNGGTSGNCWDDSMSSFGGDEPQELEDLDNLLESICPSITFLQYKRIKKLASMNIWTDYGYYGGSEQHSQWELDTKALYDELVDMSIIVE